MAPTIPTNFNDTDALIDFAKDTGLVVGLGVLIPAVLLSAILIFVFVKYCAGEGKTRQEFRARERMILLVLAAITTVICVATCAVAWSYNEKIHSGVKDGSGTLQGVIITSSTLMDNVNNTVSNLNDNLITEIHSQTIPIIDNLTDLFIPLNGVLGVVYEASGTLQNLTSLTKVIVNNISAVQNDIGTLAGYEQMGIIDNAPNPSDIPDVDNEYVESLNSSLSNLNDVVENVKNMTNDVNDTLIQVSTKITASLINQTLDYNEKADSVLSYITEFQDKIGRTNNTYNDVSSDVIHYSNLRKQIVAAILVLPITLTGLALAGAIFKIKILLKISAAFCFVFMFWYFVVAGLNYVAFYTLDQVCENQDVIVSNALAINSGTINIPAANVSIIVSQKVTQLMKCSGNNTLINIFEFNFLVNDLTTQIESEVNELVNQTNQLNQTADYQKGLESLQKMENSSVNLDFLQNSSLPTVHQQLTNISSDLNQTINGPAYFQTLKEVNDITNDLLLNNGTTIHVYYGENNITSLNCTADPYNKISQSAQQELCAKAGVAINATIIRNLSILHAASIYSNVTDIENRLLGFEAALPTIEAYQNQTSVYSSSIRGFLGDAFNRSNAIMGQVASAALAISGVISVATEGLDEGTQCAFLGDAYSDLSKNMCSDVSDSLEVIAAMMLIGGVMLFISAVVSILFSYRLERDFYTKQK